ncbi:MULTISPECIES: hypothetical protein [Roseivirga]|jgi:predicted secreted protein|uniref:hypothetical protein n=1 Tax=Roseivirga TaxID=290180 RepID=UPI00257C9F2E|nr:MULTISPECIES: hypothetical protein [Roseivirga]|tara:strand:- start:11239 stop:12216 length:978 start_codon:yes stop_codon:yes gene_type:complete
MKHIAIFLICIFPLASFAQEFEDPITTTDWNLLWKSAFIQSNGAANAPEGSGWFWGINMNHSSNNSNYRYNGQIAIKNNNTVPTLYFRSTGVSGIGTWTKVLHNTGTQQINGNLHINAPAVGNTLNNYELGAKIDIGRQKLEFVSIRTANESDWKNTTLKLQAKIDVTKHQSIDFVNDSAWHEHIDILTGNQVFNTRFTYDGKVGIGTKNPDSELTVNGNIHAKEVKVDLNIPAPDYVFEPDYKLRTLKETKEYIMENKHLPEIPSATEIGENGIDLGDMNMRLLKKIEELTLYQIELMERLEQLESRNAEIDELKEKIKSLENK